MGVVHGEYECWLCEEAYQVTSNDISDVCPNCGAPLRDTWPARVLAEAEAICSELNEYELHDSKLAERIERITAEIGLRRDGTFNDVYPNGF